jgi:hypothetical protein
MRYRVAESFADAVHETRDHKSLYLARALVPATATLRKYMLRLI